MAKQLWAPWRLEYIAQADEEPGCVFCDAAAGDDAERLVVHRGEHAFVAAEQVPVRLRPSDGRLVPARRRLRRAYGRRGARGPPPRQPWSRRAGRRLLAPGLQPRLEPRPRCGRGHRRSRSPARRPPVGGRHQLHARPRGRQGAPGAPRRNPPRSSRRLAQRRILRPRRPCRRSPRRRGRSREHRLVLRRRDVDPALEQVTEEPGVVVDEERGHRADALEAAELGRERPAGGP